MIACRGVTLIDPGPPKDHAFYRVTRSPRKTACLIYPGNGTEFARDPNKERHVMLKWLQALFAAGSRRLRVEQSQAPGSQSPDNRDSPGPAPTIVVRGRYWKNTAEPGQTLQSRDTVPAAAGLEGLIGELRSDNRTDARLVAVEALAQLGSGAAPAIEELLRCSVDTNQALREAALKALVAIDPSWPASAQSRNAIPFLVNSLRNRHSPVAEAAVRLLGRIGPAAVPGLKEALATATGAGPQLYIARALRAIGAAAGEAVPELARALGSEFPQSRIAAAEALGAIGEPARGAAPALAQALSDDFAKVREAAANCLARLGPAAEPAVLALLPLLADQDADVRKAAAAVLEHVGPRVVPSLMEIVQSRDFVRMRTAVQTSLETADWFGRLKRDNVAMAPFQTAHNFFWHQLEAMEERERLEDAHEAALGLLEKFGTAAAAALPAIVGALVDRNLRVRLAAIRALGQIGPDARSAVSRLAQLLADGNESIRATASQTLRSIDGNWEASPEVNSATIVLSHDLGVAGKRGDLAASALATIGSAAVPVLVEGLRSTDRIIRERSATALGHMGSPAKEAVPALTTALKDENQWVQQAAAKALARLGIEARTSE